MEHSEVTRFTSLWTRTQSSILAFIASTVRNFADAEDVLQRVAEVAVSKFDQFDRAGDASAFTGWAIRIARFEVLRFLRSHATDRHRFLAEAVAEIAEAFEDIAPECDARRHALAECVGQLEGRSRDVVTLRYGEGLKTGRIAEQLALTPGNVSVILNRAYKALARCIATRLAPEGV